MVWLAGDGVPRCAPVLSSNLVPFGRCGGTREAGSTIAESLVALYRVGKHQIRRRRRAALSSTRASKERRTGKIRGAFQGCTGLWTAGCWLARRLHQLKAPTTIDLGISTFLNSVRCMALKNLGLLIKTDWSVLCPLCC